MVDSLRPGELMDIVGLETLDPEQMKREVQAGGKFVIPWGPIWTISTLAANLRGGRDVTTAVLDSVSSRPLAAPPSGAA
jgi:hypothetical protein